MFFYLNLPNLLSTELEPSKFSKCKLEPPYNFQVNWNPHKFSKLTGTPHIFVRVNWNPHNMLKVFENMKENTFFNTFNLGWFQFQVEKTESQHNGNLGGSQLKINIVKA